MSNYWANTLHARIGRRRALAATGAGALAAGLLAACSGDDEPSSGSGNTSNSRVTQPADTTSRAKVGGVLKGFQTTDAFQGLDPLTTNHGDTVLQAALVYGRMLKFTVAKYPEVAIQSVEGDVAQSYELSPDKLTLTFKLRQGLKWDSRAPTSSRLLDAEDILYSWNKFANVHPASSDLAYDSQRAPAAPITSVSSPDKSTIVFKLNKPDTSLLPLLATWDHLWILPKEADGGFNSKTEMRGTGPWMLEKYEPSASFTFRKNPDYYVKGLPYPDVIERPIMPEYATRLAQFIAGNVYMSVPSSNDVLQTKNDVPELVMMQDIAFPSTTSSYHCSFGYEGDSPFKDVRIRRALSMSVDREGMTDAITNRDRFTSQGFDVPSKRNTILLPGWDGYWLDPTNEQEFGPNAKYFNYDLKEVKAMLSAAGRSDGVSFNFYTNPAFPQPGPQVPEVFAGAFLAAGFKVNMVPLSPNEWFTGYYNAYSAKDATGKAKGYTGLLHLGERPFPTVASLMYGYWHKDSGLYKGVTPDGLNVDRGDPALNSLIEKMRVEFDEEKSKALAKDIQRLLAGQTYHIPNAGSIKGYNVFWPALANVGAFSIFGGNAPASTSGPGATWQEGALHWWIDDTKAPLGRS